MPLQLSGFALLLFILFIGLLSLTTSAADTPNIQQPAEDSSSGAVPTKAPKKTRTEPSPQAELIDALFTDPRQPGSELLDLNSDVPNYSALLTERSTKIKRGITLLFPDSRTHSDWPIFTQVLRNELPQDGWTTLSLVLPNPTTQNLPKRTLPSLKRLASTSNTSQPPDNQIDASTEPANQPPQKEPTSETTSAQKTNNATYIMQQGMAAIQTAQQQGYDTIVLVGVGDGANWAAALGVNVKDQINISLLMLDATQSTDINAPVFIQLIPQLNFPVMDIYASSPANTRLEEMHHKARLSTANRSELVFYQQSRLPITSRSTGDQDWMLSYIKGRLRTLKSIADAPMPAEQTQSSIPLIDQRPGSSQ